MTRESLSQIKTVFSRMYTRLITRIETGCHRLGKDDKFQLFVCLAVHDRLLGKIVTDLTKAVAAQHVSLESGSYFSHNIKYKHWAGFIFVQHLRGF